MVRPAGLVAVVLGILMGAAIGTPALSAQPAQVALSPAASSGAVRIGLHAEMTRFVLEMSDSVTFQVSTEADPPQVVVELPALAWAGGPGPFPGRGLVSRYHATAGKDGGTRLVIETKGSVQVRDAFRMVAKDNLPPRLVIDIARGETTPASATIPAWSPEDAAKDKRPLSPPTITALVAPVPIPPPAAAPAPTPAPPPVSAKPNARPAPPVSAPAPAPARPPVIPTIALDPGHGGVDPGALSSNGVREKDITLATGLELKRLLEATGHYKVFMTRDHDVFVPLRDRVAAARDAGADLFVSLHADTI
jgi:N-acetylmuramoyl-L-alanine amidase